MTWFCDGAILEIVVCLNQIACCSAASLFKSIIKWFEKSMLGTSEQDKL